MINKSKIKNPMPVIDIEKRKSTFEEVEIGYSDSLAKSESLRCLNCKNAPCKSGCPVGVNIPLFINLVSQGNISEAYDTIIKDNLLPSICGRVCPQEKQCESKCIRAKSGEPVAIGRLERYVADKAKNLVKVSENKTKNIKVAVVGSGPSGLTCAGELCSKGYEVTIFEALHTPGGVLAYGIPSFRLPREVLDFEIKKLKSMGVRIETNMVIGKTLSIQDIFDMGYKAIYISTGAGLPKFMGVPGEGLSGVYSANEFLTRINLMNAHNSKYDTPINIPRNLVVIGGGNVAMDVARSALRIGCKNVSVIYRRTQLEMPARRDEILHAQEEGVNFMFLKTPLEFLGENGVLKKIKYASMELTGKGNDGRNEFKVNENDVNLMEVDAAIISIGNGANKILYESEKNIDFQKNGCIVANEETRTSKKYVYAGGDAVTGAATVILAMGAGKKAAETIDKDLS